MTKTLTACIPLKRNHDFTVYKNKLDLYGAHITVQTLNQILQNKTIHI